MKARYNMFYEFDGITTEQFNEQDKDNFFITDYTDQIFISKDTFTVELENKDVELHLFIEDLDMADYDDTTDHSITMGVLPSFDSLSDKNKENILHQFNEEDREEVQKDPMALLREMLSYGFGIPLHSEQVESDEVEYTVNSAIAVRFGVQGLIGFELDIPRNRIGCTGWDFLDDYCNDIPAIDKALARYNNK